MSDRHNDGVTSGTDSGVGTGFALGATACSKSSIELGTVRIGGVQYTVGAMIFFQGIKKEKKMLDKRLTGHNQDAAIALKVCLMSQIAHEWG